MLVAYLMCLSSAVVSDVRSRRVKNESNAVLAAVGLLAGALSVSQSAGVIPAALSVLTGFACWIGFWMLGVLGAGDVKFFAAASAWFAPAASWRLAVLSALLGGALSLAWTVYHRGAAASMQALAVTIRHPARVRLGESVPEAPVREFPYALPMALAFAGGALFPSLPFLVIPRP